MQKVAYPIKKGQDESGKPCILVCVCLVPINNPIDVKKLPSDIVAIDLSVCKTMFVLYKRQSIEEIDVL